MQRLQRRLLLPYSTHEVPTPLEIGLSHHLRGSVLIRTRLITTAVKLRSQQMGTVPCNQVLNRNFATIVLLAGFHYSFRLVFRLQSRRRHHYSSLWSRAAMGGDVDLVANDHLCLAGYPIDYGISEVEVPALMMCQFCFCDTARDQSCRHSQTVLGPSL